MCRSVRRRCGMTSRRDGINITIGVLETVNLYGHFHSARPRLHQRRISKIQASFRRGKVACTGTGGYVLPVAAGKRMDLPPNGCPVA
jgi:hypothetical protein